MQQSPLTLRQRLIHAVDKSYHVKDMGEIVEVLGTLEVLPVTKELLESTRLGKTVNEFRRRTNDEKLAKRAKALVKKWRDVVLVPPIFIENEASAPEIGANNANDQPENVSLPQKRGRRKKQKMFIDAETLLHQQIAQAQQESKIRTVHRLSMEVFEEDHSRPSDFGTEQGRKPPSPVFTIEPVIKSEIVEKYLLSQNELRTKMERQYQDSVDRNELPLLPTLSADREAGDDQDIKQKKKDKNKNKDAAAQPFPSESEILSRLPPIDPQILEELKNFQFEFPSESEEAKSKISEIETEIPASLTTTNETTNGVNKNTEGLKPSKIDWGDSDDEDDFMEVSTKIKIKVDVVDCDLPTTEPTPTLLLADDSVSSPMDISTPQEQEQEYEPVLKEVQESDVDRLHLEKVENLNGNFDKDGQFKEWHEVLGVESFKGELLHILPYTIIDF